MTEDEYWSWLWCTVYAAVMGSLAAKSTYGDWPWVTNQAEVAADAAVRARGGDPEAAKAWRGTRRI